MRFVYTFPTRKLLLGITARDWLTFYPHFLEEGKTIIQDIQTFYERNIKEKFSLKTCMVTATNNEKKLIILTLIILDIFDVIMPKPDEILLVDFGPLNQKTKLYAFNWKEIQPIMKKVYTFPYS